MSKKNLLNESTIRRFMALANMEPLAEPFVGRLNEMGDYDSMPPGDRDEDEEEILDVVPLDSDVPPGEEEEEVIEPEVSPEVHADVERIVRNVIASMDDALTDDGLPDVIQMEAAPEEEEVGDVGDVGDVVDAIPPEEDTVEEASGESLEQINVFEDDDLINEVAKRVTARLVKTLASRKKS